MNPKTFALITLILICLENYSWSQHQISFDEFTGTVYYIPKDEVKKGYSPEVLDYTIISEIKLDSLRIPKTNDYDSLFPGLTRKAQFGIIFNNQMIVEAEGCYEISLESDDGSILWINDQEILNNDGAHRMTEVRDTVLLKPWDYKIKIWYYNAYPAQYGLIFKVLHLLNESSCKSIENILFEKEDTLITLDDILFNLNSSVLSQSGQKMIENIADSLKAEDFQSIKVIGHTDDLGPKELNMKLSLNRASTVLKYLKQKLNMHEVTFQAEGKGSEFPKVPNINEQNRQTNRRVEIIIE